MNITHIQSKLPTNPGINGRDEYLNSVVLVLLVPVDGEYHIVFEKRAAHIRQGGEISFPGGRIDEEDKTLADTAIRETTEELGIPADKITILGQLDTVVAPYGVIIDVFVGVAEIDLAEIQINDEVEYFFTLPISYFQLHKPDEYEVKTEIHPKFIDPATNEEVVLFPTAALNLPPRYQKPWGGFHNKVFVYKVNNEVIWGITARVVKDFVERL